MLERLGRNALVSKGRKVGLGNKGKKSKGSEAEKGET